MVAALLLKAWDEHIEQPAILGAGGGCQNKVFRVVGAWYRGRRRSGCCVGCAAGARYCRGAARGTEGNQQEQRKTPDERCAYMVIEQHGYLPLALSLWGCHTNRCERERRRCKYAWRTTAAERCWGVWIARQNDRFDPISAAIQIGNDAVIGADQAPCGR